MSSPRTARVKVLKPAFIVEVTWTTGSSDRIDLTSSIQARHGLSALRELTTFRKVTIGEGGDSLTWPGELDMGADRLHELALEQAGHADAVAITRWRQRHALTLKVGADALGISRRMWSYYEGGAKPVPKAIALACVGWESMRNEAA